MENRIECSFRNVSEHDMDMLFLEEFTCSDEFLGLFTSEVGLEGARVTSVAASLTDPVLGESDMTVTVEKNGEKIGLLIEDKIDAAAMPDQAARYVSRGEKGVAGGKYDRFFVFIAAPEKYLKQNEEAKRYPHRITYETILAYFEKLNGDRRSDFKIQQIKQAIESQRPGYRLEENAAVTEFWRRYSEYQRESFGDLFLLYRGDAKGYNATWPRFRTVIDGLYMYHKSEFGVVDLTFEGCSDRIAAVEKLLFETLGDHTEKGFFVHVTGKSAAVRRIVPFVDFHLSFDDQLPRIEECFASLRQMSDTVKCFDADAVRAILSK